MSEQGLQKILDHFGLGKIQKWEVCLRHYRVTTNKGEFIILESEIDIDSTRNAESERRVQVEKDLGSLKRMLLPDYKGELQEYSSYIHKKGKYYSVYQLN